MARLYGGNADLYLDDTQIEGWMDSVSISFDVGIGNITSFTDVFENVVAGKKNTTIDISGSHDTATSAADEVIFECIGAGVKTTKLEFSSDSVSANNPSYQCTASGLVGSFISRYSISLPVGDKASFTASIQNSGETTRETS